MVAKFIPIEPMAAPLSGIISMDGGVSDVSVLGAFLWVSSFYSHRLRVQQAGTRARGRQYGIHGESL